MLKKGVAMMLAATLMVSLVACGSPAKKTEAESTAAAGTTAEAAKTETEAASEAKDNAGEVEIKEDAIVMRIGGTCTASDKVSEYLAMQKLAELVEKYSDGTIRAEVYPASQLGSTGELAEGIMLGSLECAVIGLDAFQSYNPITCVTSLPYIFENYDVVRDTLDGKNSVGQAIYASLLENNNTRVLAGMHRGYRGIAITKRATGAADDVPFTPDDLKGLRVRTPSVKTISDVVASFGAQPVAVANAEIATSLSQGVIDGIDYGFTELWAQQWDGVKYVLETQHAATDVVSMVSESWFQTLTKEQQDAIVKAGQEAGEYRYQLMLEEAETARETLRGWGIVPVYGDMIDLEAFRASSAHLIESWIGTYVSQEMYDEIVALNEAAK